MNIYTSEELKCAILNQRRIKMAHFNSLRSDTSNDLKRAPLKGAVLNLHWYKIIHLLDYLYKYVNNDIYN
jgi:hypothetical protein